MNAEERYAALAARAVGEEMPGAGDSLSREPTPESGELEHLVALLRSAELPTSEERREAVLVRLAAEPKTPRGLWVGLIAASILVVVVSVFATRPTPDKTQVLSPTTQVPVEEPVFGEVFAARTWDIAEEPLAGPLPPAGAGRGKPDFLLPFANQAEFPLLVPASLPVGARLVQARYRRAEIGVRPFSFLWLEYAGPDGRFIVLQAPDGPRVRQALDELELPRGWSSAGRSAHGVRALAASPEIPGAELARLSARLAPLAN